MVKASDLPGAGDLVHAVAIGQPAPDFALLDHEGQAVTLRFFTGKALVLFFYPKDDTSGCTAEALDFSAKADAFAQAGAAVLGVSPDSVKSHAKFRSKHALALALASDENKTALQAYGVWVEKSNVRPQVHGGGAHHGARGARRADGQGLAEGQGQGPRRRGARGGSRALG